MGNLKSKKKKKMGCSSSTNDNGEQQADSEKPKIPENPCDLKVLYEAIRDADALRQSGEVENAVVILSNAFDNALAKLGEVPDEVHQDTVLIMQVIKECNSAWKHKNIAYNPPYRRLRHLKLDQNQDDGDEGLEDLNNQMQQENNAPGDAVADQKAEEPVQERAPFKKKSPVKFDDSKIITKQVKPIEVKKDAKPLFSQTSISEIRLIRPTDPDIMYMNLWRADQLRIDDRLDEALDLLLESFDDCIYNLHAANKKDKSTINEILQVFRETQHRWENNEENYSPDFDRLRVLQIDYLAAENAV